MKRFLLPDTDTTARAVALLRATALTFIAPSLGLAQGVIGSEGATRAAGITAGPDAPAVDTTCPGAQGSATLEISGLPQVGGTITLTLSGPPNQPFCIGMNDHIRPVRFSGGTFCIDSSYTVLHRSSGFGLPPDGSFTLELGIPDDPALVGTTFFFQALVGAPRGPGSIHITDVESVTFTGHPPVDTVFCDDFEGGWGNWYADNGQWQVGIPTSGPSAAYSGSKCAATNLSGNYAAGAFSRLVSPLITLPDVGSNERLRLSFQSWFSYAGGDAMTIQVRHSNTWESVSCTDAHWAAGWQWCQSGADLTAYAGEQIRLGFLIASDYYYGESTGSYIDDVLIFRGTPSLSNPETWQGGLGNWWYASRGQWQVGEPICAPVPTPSGDGTCVGTHLDANYAPGSDSRLTSPPFELVGNTGLRFWHWFSFAGGDYGRVEVSADGGCSWTLVGGNYTAYSGGWTQTFVDLSAYDGQTIQVGFRILSDYYYGESCGWYLDDLLLQ